MAGQVRVLALMKYDRIGASSRYRFFNYIPLLADRGIKVTAAPLLTENYVRRRLAGLTIDYLDVARSYSTRLATIVNAFRFDVLWIEAELLPRGPAAFERLLRVLGQRLIVDLDDAIFHSYERHPNLLVRKLLGRKIDAVFRQAETVIAGNEYLAEQALQTGARQVITVPTSVDHRVYAERSISPHDKLTFGWIGSPATAHYLQTIAPQLNQLCKSLNARLRLIGLDRHSFEAPDVVLSDWSEETEIEELAKCDIGLAPLTDGHWERGKCGIKAIQYMALGIPVLAADVGALSTIVQHGNTGFVYRNGTELSTYARQLAYDPELRRRMGQAGRKRVAEHYSIYVWADKIAEILNAAAKR